VHQMRVTTRKIRSLLQASPDIGHRSTPVSAWAATRGFLDCGIQHALHYG
jgi:hypothetical protein